MFSTEDSNVRDDLKTTVVQVMVFGSFPVCPKYECWVLLASVVVSLITRPGTCLLSWPVSPRSLSDTEPPATWGDRERSKVGALLLLEMCLFG
ncbi:hypothetical protein O3P69_003841 [Scylla paramamosain]|uniref:Uncharacterized protein n=1 Tax=Scylla paramamosain TaxID=85552 RepID=A0AAW0UDK9_SCYPA